jgi:hypothetical protein
MLPAWRFSYDGTSKLAVTDCRPSPDRRQILVVSTTLAS